MTANPQAYTAGSPPASTFAPTQTAIAQPYTVLPNQPSVVNSVTQNAPTAFPRYATATHDHVPTSAPQNVLNSPSSVIAPMNQNGTIVDTVVLGQNSVAPKVTPNEFKVTNSKTVVATSKSQALTSSEPASLPQPTLANRPAGETVLSDDTPTPETDPGAIPNDLDLSEIGSAPNPASSSDAPTGADSAAPSKASPEKVSAAHSILTFK